MEYKIPELDVDGRLLFLVDVDGRFEVLVSAVGWIKPRKMCASRTDRLSSSFLGATSFPFGGFCVEATSFPFGGFSVEATSSF